MKETLLIVFVSMPCLLLHAQVNQSEAKRFIPCAERDFPTAGDQEECWHEEVFRNEYTKENYDRYSASIQQIKKGFVFSGKTLLTDGDPFLIAAAERGLLYPQLLVGDSALRQNWAAWKAQPAQKRTFQDFVAPDTLSFSGMKEVLTVSSPQRRRFSCWLRTPRIANPTFIYFEFTNKHATSWMDAVSFMRGARLTFLRRGSIIL
jgi:hypothetical protein